MDRYLIVMLGGAVGSLARYTAASAIMGRIGGRFPMGTLVVNVSGSFLIGLLNVIGSVGFGYMAVWLGAMLAGRRP